MANVIENSEIELECGNCGDKTKKSTEWLKEHDRFTCGCGTTIFVDPGKYRKELVKTESELDGVQGLMEKLGK
jgi:hypothetical protein